MKDTKIDTLYQSIIASLGDNYSEDDNSEIFIKDTINDYKLIASNESHRNEEDELLKPYIKKAVISAYLRRGKEGSSSNSEGGLSDSYIDIEEKLRKDVLSIRVLP